jgi:hypothetical protein
MKLTFGIVALAVLLLPSIAVAQQVATPSTTPSEHRLTPEQVEAVLSDVAAKRKAEEKRAQATAMPDIEVETPAPPVYGEVGASFGTDGYRELFGTTVYPLGNNGVAAISLDFVNLGRRRIRH